MGSTRRWEFARSDSALRWTGIALAFVLALVQDGEALRFSGAQAHAILPPWSGCPNASFSFDFRTQNVNQMLWYVDDGGQSDFFEVSLDGNGTVSLVLRIVDESNGNVRLNVGNRFNDGRWHRVAVRRRRMETELVVDRLTTSAVSFGSDFEFGRGSNSYVYLGGLPQSCVNTLSSYSDPSVCFKPHLSGSIRNVMYDNCTCRLERVAHVSGESVGREPGDGACDRTTCPEGCACVTSDSDTPSINCSCPDRQCASDITHYELPMDSVTYSASSRIQLANPSGLDALVHGQLKFREGISNRAIELDGKNTYIKVTGPGHREECLGNLALCQNGYTLTLWVFFETQGSDYVFLSNGGHSTQSHGVALIHGRRIFEVRFKEEGGTEWIVRSDGLLLRRWYHLAVSWRRDQGLFLYTDGVLSGTNSTFRSGASGSGSQSNDFVIGRPNDVTTVAEQHVMVVDEFNFWSVFRTGKEIREIGPFYRYYASMNSAADVTKSNLQGQVRGQPRAVPGKVGNALEFSTGQDYFDCGNHGDSCLGNLTLCQYGVTISMWIMFKSLQDTTYVLSSGSQAIKLYYERDAFKCEVWEKRNVWTSSWYSSNIELRRWYFLELSWSKGDWLRLYVDLRQIMDNDESGERDGLPSTGSTLYIGRSSQSVQNAGSFVIDDLELWYGDRDRLIKFNFTARGIPMRRNIGMDTIQNNALDNPSLGINVFGGPRIIQGRVYGALYLNGVAQYASIANQTSTCFGNLDFCRHGFLLSSWLKFSRLQEGMEIFSTGSNGVHVRYVNGMLRVYARTSVREWNLGTSMAKEGVWYFVEVLWDFDSGLALMIDNSVVAANRTSAVRSSYADDSSDSFFIGRGASDSTGNYGNLTIDDFDYWFASRDYLIAFNYLQRGRPQHFVVHMDQIQNGRLPHRDLNITVVGNATVVAGRINGAIHLEGSSSYLDFGDLSESCLGNPRLCAHGFTGSIFLNFRGIRENTTCLSSGYGMKVLTRGSRLVVMVQQGNRQWRVETTTLDLDKWYFIEYTWHRETGLLAYVNNKLIGRQVQATVGSYPRQGPFRIGRYSTSDEPSGFAEILVDEMELWYGTRETLMAFGYVLREVTSFNFTMNEAVGNRIVHSDYKILMHDGARLGSGKVGNGVYLQGSSGYVSFGDQEQNCLGNLKMCTHGMTLAFYLNLLRMTNGAYLLSSGSYSVFFRNGRLYARFGDETKTWELSTNFIKTGSWQKFEFSWDESGGLKLYVDQVLVNSTSQYVTHSESDEDVDYTVYIGRPSGGSSGGKFINGTIDELQYWFANRDLLSTLNIIDTDVSEYCTKDMCLNSGLCVEQTYGFYCDCSLTSYIGPFCSQEAAGYEFGLKGGRGGMASFIMTLGELVKSHRIAFGFMMREGNGTLLRLGDSRSTRFIEMRLVNGILNVFYDDGSGMKSIAIGNQRISTDQYHRVGFITSESGFKIQLDDSPEQTYDLDFADSSVFEQLDSVDVGARKDTDGILVDQFRGIISGVYVNGYRMVDSEVIKEEKGSPKKVALVGDAAVAKHPFDLSPKSEAQVGTVVAGSEDGPRASAYSGAMLGVLMAVSSLMWALYKCKPGMVGSSPAPEKASGGVFGQSGFGGNAGNAAMVGSASGKSASVAFGGSSGGGQPARCQDIALTSLSGQGTAAPITMELGPGQNICTTSVDMKTTAPTSSVAVTENFRETNEGSNVVIISSNFAGNAANAQESSMLNVGHFRASEEMGYNPSMAGMTVRTQDMSYSTNASTPGMMKTSEHKILSQTTYANAGFSQDTSNLTITGDRTVAGMIVDRNMAGTAGWNVGGTGMRQESSQMTVTTGKVSSEQYVGGISGEVSDRNVVQSNLNVNTSRGQERSASSMSEFMMTSRVVESGHHLAPNVSQLTATRSTSEMRSSQQNMTENFGKTVSGQVKPTIHLTSTSVSKNEFVIGTGVPSSPEVDRTEELIKSSVKTIDGRTIVKTNAGAVTEGMYASMDGRTLMTLDIKSAATGSKDLKAGASLDRSSSFVLGQAPKTIKIESPVKSPGEHGRFGVAPSLERSTSLVRGEPPKTLKIESPVNLGPAAVQGQAGLSPLDSLFQSGTLSSYTMSVNVKGYGGMPQAEGNPMQPTMSGSMLNTGRYQIRNMPLNGSQEELYGRNLHTSSTSQWLIQSAMGGHYEGLPYGNMPVKTVRISSIVLTTNGNNLVSGSNCGPPQVWDMKTGERVRIMEGDNLSSTELHLAKNDTLLVGQVSELQQTEAVSSKGKLQIWDFESGRSLKMKSSEEFTASSLMQNGKHIILGRTEPSDRGNTSFVMITLWDILTNQPVRRISSNVSIPTDRLTYVNESTDSRFILAGFKNPVSGNATYVTFDLTATSFDVTKPAITELSAEVASTVVLRNHEAVTGTKVGGLVVWSLRTGKLTEQFVAPPGEVPGNRAHQKEIKDLVVSKDGQYLLSAAADAVLRLWNVDTKLHVKSFIGHSDEVCCCSISNDNELAVSGSRDQTIRLWRLDDGSLVTSISASAVISRVMLSNDKKTIAALADQAGTHRLIMLQVVRTKVKKRVESRGQSTDTPDSPFSPDTSRGFSLTPDSE